MKAVYECDTAGVVAANLRGRPLLQARTAAADMFALEAMNGPFDGKQWHFEQSIIIGRDAAVAQAIVPTDRTVSRKHAEVCAQASGFELRDLSSSNGTFVEGRPIDASVIIISGQPFVVGRTMLRVIELR